MPVISCILYFMKAPPLFPEASDVNCDYGVNSSDAMGIFKSLIKGDQGVYCCFGYDTEQGDPSFNPRSVQIKSTVSGEVEKSLFGDFIDVDLVRVGENEPLDTIYVGGQYQFRIWVENSQPLFGLSIVSKVQFGDGIGWSWIEENPDPWSIKFVTSESGTRFVGRLDATGLIIRGSKENGGSVCAGGLGNQRWISPGPAEPMISFNFRIDSLLDSGERTICFDSSTFGPYDTDLVFAYQDGSGVYPDVMWPDGGKYYTVAMPPCGDANLDGSVSVGDVVYVINYVFKGGPSPSFVADANGDSQTNIGDAVYLINYVFRGGPPPVGVGGCNQ